MYDHTVVFHVRVPGKFLVYIGVKRSLMVRKIDTAALERVVKTFCNVEKCRVPVQDAPIGVCHFIHKRDKPA